MSGVQMKVYRRVLKGRIQIQFTRTDTPESK
jgi:hypothetical protein